MSTKTKKITKDKVLDIPFELKQLGFLDTKKKFQPTNEFVVVENENVIRPCKENYIITSNREIYDGVKEQAEKLGYSVTSFEPLRTNQGLFVFVDAYIKVPTEINHLITSVKIFVVDGNSEDISLSSGLLFTLSSGTEFMYYNKDLKSGTRSTKSFKDRKLTIPTIISNATLLSIKIMDNLIKLMDKTAPDNFVETNYKNSSIGPKILGANAKSESNILDVEESTNMFINKYADKSLSGYIVGFIDGIVTRFNDQNISTYDQLFTPQTSINKKITPLVDKYLIK